VSPAPPGDEQKAALLRRLPAIDRSLARPEVAEVFAGIGQELAAELCREEVEELRAAVLAGEMDGAGLERAEAGLPRRLGRRLDALLSGSLRPVVNATGVAVHTNLGRSPLCDAAVRRVATVARGYSTLEYDLERGARGSRQTHASRLLDRLFPGRGSLVVNNNAAAVLLGLNTLAQGREAVVSRGELVEIGGSFRIPEIMAKSGARLREVGTTNRTRISDYEAALSPETGVLLKVWPSNYRIVGFTAEVGVAQLAALARERGVPLMVDQGCGALTDLSPWGITDEPTVSALLEAGAGLVCFSGDKLLGGPQAGILVGDPEIVDRCRSNPLARALRCDKMTLAALEATLAAWVGGRQREEVPVAAMLTPEPEALAARAEELAARIRGAGDEGLEVEVLRGSSRVGGGAAPEVDLEGFVVALRREGFSAAALERGLRRHDPPVIARVAEGRLLLDPRTLLAGEEETVAAAVGSLLEGGAGS
jgi:L-seryl-tRNA(Ser) seleniumtransferase